MPPLYVDAGRRYGRDTLAEDGPVRRGFLPRFPQVFRVIGPNVCMGAIERPHQQRIHLRRRLFDFFGRDFKTVRRNLHAVETLREYRDSLVAPCSHGIEDGADGFEFVPVRFARGAVPGAHAHGNGQEIRVAGYFKRRHLSFALFARIRTARTDQLPRFQQFNRVPARYPRQALPTVPRCARIRDRCDIRAQWPFRPFSRRAPR